MWTLQISIMCLVFATWHNPIESSSPDEHLPGFSRRDKLSIRWPNQHPSSQSSAGPSNSRQQSQLPAWELSLAAERYPHGPEFHSSTSHCRVTEHPPAMHPAAAMHSATAESSLRSRSRSPPGKPPSYSKIFGTNFKDLRFQRYFPLQNLSRELVIRLYDFRPGTQIYLRDRSHHICEPLTGVQFILSGVNGDALALVKKLPSSYTTLRGLFMPPAPNGLRAKINIFTHHVSAIETEEAKDTPLGKSSFNEYLTRKTVDVPVEPFFPVGPTFLSIPPFLKIFGIKIEELPFYRFFPVRNTSWELAIQLHTFAPGAEIYLRIRGKQLDPEKPIGVHYTLSDISGNIVALVQKLPSNHSTIRGLYRPTPLRANGDRVKINIFTDSVRKMEDNEIQAIPLGKNKETRKLFDIRYVGVRFAPIRQFV